MKGPDISLKHLQRALTMELTTVNTYLLQERTLDDWGVDRLAERMREEIGEETGHARAFLTRILFLEGTANVHDLDPIRQDGSIREVFETQLRMEREATAYYARAANECREAGDLGSFDLFMTTLRDEEEHVDFVETQLRLIELMGEQLYVARQVSSMGAEENDED
jgi:bacterioferritin